MARSCSEVAKASKAHRAKRSEQVEALEQEFRRALGVRVEILARGKDKGRIVLHFASQEDFDRIRANRNVEYALLEFTL